jgi:cell division ATPase FtsA
MSEEQKEVVVPDPTLTPPVEPKPPEIDKDSLLSELTKMGVTKADDLHNMKRASSEAGNLANLLGQARNETAELKRMIQQMQQGQNAGYQPQDAQPIDLGQVVESKAEKAVERVFQKMNAQQMQAQEQVEAEMADIEGDAKFPILQETFQRHIGSRATQLRFRRGETTLTKEYSRLKDVWMDKMLEAHTNALKLTQPSVKAPHVEQGGTHSPQLPEAATESAKKLRNITEQRSQGKMSSDQAMEAMVKELFPSDMFKI